MLNRQLYKVKEGINKCANIVNIADINFTMSLARIDDEITRELRVIEKGKKSVPIKYREYLKKRQLLDIDHAIEKEDGTFQILSNSLLIRDPKKYYKSINLLDEEYKEELKVVETINKEFEEYLDKECNVTISTILKSCIPTQVNVEQMRLLYPVIK